MHRVLKNISLLFMSDEEISFDEALEGILRKDARYARPAYYFVRDGLSFTSKERNERNKTHCSDDAGALT